MNKSILSIPTTKGIGGYDYLRAKWDESKLRSTIIRHPRARENYMLNDSMWATKGGGYMNDKYCHMTNSASRWFPKAPVVRAKTAIQKTYTQLILRDDQKEIAEYLLSKNNDINMVATFIKESWLNPYAVWSVGERWMCQLMPNATNNVWIDDLQRSDWKRQADRCVDKRLAVKDKNIRTAYKIRFKYLR